MKTYPTTPKKQNQYFLKGHYRTPLTLLLLRMYSISYVLVSIGFILPIVWRKEGFPKQNNILKNFVLFGIL